MFPAPELGTDWIDAMFEGFGFLLHEEGKVRLNRLERG